MFSQERRLLLALAAAPVAVSALPWDGPAPTPSTDNFLGWTPRPTEAAVLAYNDLFANNPFEAGLFQRQLGVNTCGYFDQRKKYPYVCDQKRVCVSNTVNNNFGCCLNNDDVNVSACLLYTSCVPYVAISALCKDGSCATDGFLNVCSSSQYGECVTYFLEFDGTRTLSQLQCGSSTAKYTLYNTYSGLASGFQLTYGDTYTMYTSAIYNTLSSFFPPPSSPTSSKTTTTHAPATTPSAAAGGDQTGDAGTKTSSGNDSSSNSGSGTNVGAIAGGVVGGLAVLAALVGCIIYLCLRHRRKVNQASDPINTNSAELPAYYPQGYTHPTAQPPMTEQQLYNGSYDQDASYAGKYDPPRATSLGEMDAATLVPYSDTAPVEADGAPIMTNAEGRPVHELSTNT